MLEKLVALTEEALAAEYDTLLFEERKPEWVAVVPTKPEKILGSGGNAVECYADCLAWDMQRGNVADPPLGMVIPERNAAGANSGHVIFLRARRKAGRAMCGKFLAVGTLYSSTGERSPARRKPSGSWLLKWGKKVFALVAMPIFMIR